MQPSFIHYPDVSTIYKLTVEDEYDIAWDTAFVDVSMVDINEFGLPGLEVNVYPNPVNNLLNIEVRCQSRQIEISITSVLGIQEQVIQLSSESGEFSSELNMGHYQNGIYLLKVKEVKGNNIYIEKLIKNSR